MDVLKCVIQAHRVANDWCHLCGSRSNAIADVWYPDNAENDPPVKPGPPAAGHRYIRICLHCADEIKYVCCGVS